jgi:glycine/D-amino acid oxidase-like deaminating enzyme
MRTRYGVSPWVTTFPDTRRPDYPRFRDLRLKKGSDTRELIVDVAIVGGGLTGCATALACAVGGLKAAVLERERIGQGGAGRGAGLLLPDPGPDFTAIVKAHGLRDGRRIFEMWRKASLDAAAQLRRLGIKCGLAPCDAAVVATVGSDTKGLRREHDARAAAGLPVSWAAARSIAQDAGLDVAGALRMHDAFGLDPYRAALGLAAALKKRGGILFERTAVKKVRPGARHVELDVDGGIVRAQTAIVTTGTATAEFKQLQRHFKARETYLVLTEVMPAVMRKKMGARALTLRDTRTPRHRIRWTDDDRILVGGADQDETPLREREAVRVQRTGQLMYELLTTYPDISGLRPEYGWELSYGETADGLMYIGPHRNFPRHLFALGGGGDSVTGAFLAARLLARAAQGALEKGDEVFGWTR